MVIKFRLAFHERMAVRFLNTLALENAHILKANPDLPLLYDSGVVYKREKVETWCDYLTTLMQGHEDCDGLAAARAGELIAKGHKALRPGDAGYQAAKQLRLRSIPAEVYLTTRNPPGVPGLYHCVVRYRLKRRWDWLKDDPSARLGMNGAIDPVVLRRWRANRRNA